MKLPAPTKLFGFWFTASTGLGTTLKLIVNSFRLLFFHFFNKAELIRNQTISTYNVNLNGKKMSLALRLQDLPVFYEIFLEKTYQLPPNWVRNKGVVIDLGAHVGLTSLYLSNTYCPDAKFICVEPSPKSNKLLQINAKTFGGTVISKAIGAEKGEILFNDEMVSYNNKVSENESKGQPIEVTTINDIFKKYDIEKVELLKIDIEGAEKGLLRDVSPWIDKVRTIIIEIHGDYTYDSFKRDVSEELFDITMPVVGEGESMIYARKKEVVNV